MAALHRRRTLRLHCRGTLSMVTIILAINQSLSPALATKAPRLRVLGTGIHLGGRSILVGGEVMSVRANFPRATGRFDNLFQE